MSKYNTCRFCDKDLNEDYKSKLYCSHECGDSYRSRKRTRQAKLSVKRECRTCKIEFIPNYKGTKRFDCSEECYKEQRRKQNRERFRKENGLRNKYDYEDIKKCKVCSADISHMRINVLYCGSTCKQRAEDRARGHKPMEEHLAILDKQKEQRKEKLKREQHQRYLERLTDKECEWCGEEFITDIINKLTCSKECSRKRKNHMKHLNSDRRINENNLIDRDITLEKLFKRDSGVCYICGEVCDYKDRTITTDGHFISGRTYPSIDHVYPLARGGMHSWDNVRLAHHSCNGEKSDDLAIGIEPLPKDIAYSLARKISPRKKKTTQHTLDGELVGVFDSTFEAERKTGLKAKGIQRCARGEAKTYKGYIWRYA